MVLVPVVMTSVLFTGAPAYFGAGLEQIVSVGGVGVIVTLAGFLILYPRT